MKKLLCLLLMVMMISVTGCSPKESPADVYRTVYDQSQQYDSESLSVELNMTFSLDDQTNTIEFPTAMVFKVADMQNTDNPQIYMDKNLNKFGETLVTETWVQDGTSYITDDEGERVVPYDSSLDPNAYIFDVADYIKGGSVEEDGTNKVLKFEVSEDAYPAIIDAIFNKNDMNIMNLTTEKMEISKCEMNVIVDEDNNFVNIESNIDLSSLIDDSELKCSIYLNVHFDDINNTTIDYPNLDEFGKTNTSISGYDGEGRVCSVDMTEGILTASMDIVFIPDDNNVLQELKVIYNVDVSQFVNMDPDVMKETLDEQMASQYTGNGISSSSTIEDGIYRLTFDFTDMSTAGQVIGAGGGLENANIDDLIPRFESNGAVCN